MTESNDNVYYDTEDEEVESASSEETEVNTELYDTDEDDDFDGITDIFTADELEGFLNRQITLYRLNKSNDAEVKINVCEDFKKHIAEVLLNRRVNAAYV